MVERVHGNVARVGEMTAFHVGPAPPQHFHALRDGRRHARALEDHVGAVTARRLRLDRFDAFLRVRHFLDVDGHVGAEGLCQFQARRGRSDHDGAVRAGLDGRGQAEQSDGAGALDDRGGPEFHLGLFGEVQADGEGFEQYRDLGRTLDLEKLAAGDVQQHVFGVSALEVGLDVGVGPESVGQHVRTEPGLPDHRAEVAGPALLPRDDGDEIALPDRLFHGVRVDAGPQLLDHAHDLVAQHEREGLAPRVTLIDVHVRAADAAHGLPYEHLSRTGIGDHRLADGKRALLPAQDRRSSRSRH